MVTKFKEIGCVANSNKGNFELIYFISYWTNTQGRSFYIRRYAAAYHLRFYIYFFKIKISYLGLFISIYIDLYVLALQYIMGTCKLCYRCTCGPPYSRDRTAPFINLASLGNTYHNIFVFWITPESILEIQFFPFFFYRGAPPPPPRPPPSDACGVAHWPSGSDCSVTNN